MKTINAHSGTNICEIADGIWRINTPVPMPPSGFSFNQYLITGEAPMLYHMGPRKLFPWVREAVGAVLPVEKLRYLALSHFEADECGSVNEWLAVAPHAEPVCGKIAALVSVGDVADRPPRALGDGETLELGAHRLRWFDTPHLPHAWDCGLAMEETTGTLLCGDLFTQPGDKTPPLTEGDILGPSEAFRGMMDYYAHCRNQREQLERLAGTNPKTLACMLRALGRAEG
ncbi:MBL fold metallo-hydrolase [bacterium]|nr:MBL fold metallo-hydrolase [bacterium]